MGVPKFFRYISERYPCLSELVRENQVPEFDNLYLDMNGVIHNCSHPNDNDVHFRITEEQIFKDIFHYLDMLFNMIKPQRLFFLAVDGVAPRAKMNQQRGRRFRSAKEAEVQEEKARQKGEVLPTEARFDSNCITPGTPFMCRLNSALRYFIQYRITNSKRWRDCKVILSGHETPGEGEHKIMEYIRFSKAQKGYDPNTRHCLYGLDADLIMLGLCTHERHFSLLREEVKFGKKTSKAVSVDQTRFFLLHLSLMREYLEQEFVVLKKSLPFAFDIEAIIDDWVLMGFLVGNDFIPNIPNLHINANALPMLYEAYVQTMPSLDGYINEGGVLNLKRLQAYIGKLAKFDRDFFESQYDDLRFVEAKHTGAYNARNEDTFGGNSDLLALVKATEFEFESSMDDEDADEDEEEDIYKQCKNDEEVFEKEFHQHRRHYYVDKMKYPDMTPEVLAEQANCYITALQWTLSYYYHGVQSWGWFYPHHYAPYISDVRDFANFEIRFELGKPFLPFQQLMSVLPAASRDHVPEAYKKLMTSSDSELIDFYPTEFETDLNGKKQEWEAVVLIPFIDEQRLLKTLQKHDSELSPDEKKRNVHGPMYVYTYSAANQGSLEGPLGFPSIGNLMCLEKQTFREEIQVPKEKLVLGPLKGAMTNVYFTGFPTLKHLNYHSQLRKQNVKVFDQPSRSENMIIVVEPGDELEKPLDELAKELLKKVVFVGWPHLVEAKVVRVSDNRDAYFASGAVEKTDMNQWGMSVETIRNHHRNRMGIDSGDVTRVVHVVHAAGEDYTFDQKSRIFRLSKVWSPIELTYPLQCVVRNVKAYRKKFKQEVPMTEAYKNGTEVFMLTNPYYGSYGEVMDVNCYEKNGRIKVLLTVPPEPDFDEIFNLHDKTAESYRNAYQTAAALSISENVLNRITGTVLVYAGKKRHVSEGTPRLNIGLQLKFVKQNEEVAGYTKKERMWLYSEKVITLVQSYYCKYPIVFEVLERNSGGNDIYFESDFFETTEGDDNISALLKWLGTMPHQKAERRTIGTESIEKEVLESIIATVGKVKDSPVKKVTMQVKHHLLYVPTLQNSTKSPDSQAQFYLFDRVVIAKATEKFSVGVKGTVIGISRVKDLNPVRQECVNKEDVYCEILFDTEISEGSSMHGTASNRIGRVAMENLLNISFGLSQSSTTTSNVKPQATKNNTRYVEKKKTNGTPQQQQQQQRQPEPLTQSFSAILKNPRKTDANASPLDKKQGFADMWNSLKMTGGGAPPTPVAIVQQRNNKNQSPIDARPQKQTTNEAAKPVANMNSVPAMMPPANLPAPPSHWLKKNDEPPHVSSQMRPKLEMPQQIPQQIQQQHQQAQRQQSVGGQFYGMAPPKQAFPLPNQPPPPVFPPMMMPHQNPLVYVGINGMPCAPPHNFGMPCPPPHNPGAYFANNGGRNGTYVPKPFFNQHPQMPPQQQQQQQQQRFYNNQRPNHQQPMTMPPFMQQQQQQQPGNPFVPLQAARKSTKGKNDNAPSQNSTPQKPAKQAPAKASPKAQNNNISANDSKLESSAVEVQPQVATAERPAQKTPSVKQSRLAISFGK